MTSRQYFKHRANLDGFCTPCNKFTVTGGVDPIAKTQRCPDCGKRTVSGADRAMDKGVIDLKE